MDIPGLHPGLRPATTWRGLAARVTLMRAGPGCCRHFCCQRPPRSSMGYEPADVRLRCLGQSLVTALTSADLWREVVLGLPGRSRLSLSRGARFTNRFTEPVLDLRPSALPRARTRALRPVGSSRQRRPPACGAGRNRRLYGRSLLARAQALLPADVPKASSQPVAHPRVCPTGTESTKPEPIPLVSGCAESGTNLGPFGSAAGTYGPAWSRSQRPSSEVE